MPNLMGRPRNGECEPRTRAAIRDPSFSMTMSWLMGPERRMFGTM